MMKPTARLSHLTLVFGFQPFLGAWSCTRPLFGPFNQRCFYGVFFAPTTGYSTVFRSLLLTPHKGTGCSLLIKRSYAKTKVKGGKKGKEDDDNEEVSLADLSRETCAHLKQSMDRSIAFLREEFTQLRLGRASPDLLQRVRVEGQPINRKASIFVKDSLTLLVTPFDKTKMQEIKQAITDAKLDLTPQQDGDSLVIGLPKATKEARDALLKQAAKLAEELRISIRRARQNAMTDIKRKKTAIPKDDFAKLEKEVQKVTDEYIGKVDAMLKIKEKDIIQT